MDIDTPIIQDSPADPLIAVDPPAATPAPEPPAQPAEPPAPPDHGADELVPVQRVRDLQSQAEQLRTRITETDALLIITKEDLASATEAYRIAVLAANPVVPSTLITGSSVAEIIASLARARESVDFIRAALIAQASPVVVVLIGSPPRGPVDTLSMSPREKIIHDLSH